MFELPVMAQNLYSGRTAWFSLDASVQKQEFEQPLNTVKKVNA
jgi:hypothetical protein